MNKNILNIKSLIKEFHCMETYGLVELELHKIEAQLNDSKSLNEEQQNILISDLSSLIEEFRSNSLSEEDLYNYFYNFMNNANVDSRSIVKY